MIPAIQDVPNPSVANLPPVTNRSAELAASQRAAPQTPSAIVDLRSELPQPLTYNAAGRLQSQIQVPGAAGNTPQGISLSVAENTRSALANLFAPPPAQPANDTMAPVAPNTPIAGLPALTVTTLLADIAENANAAPVTAGLQNTPNPPGAANTSPFAAPAPTAPAGFTTPEAAPILAAPLAPPPTSAATTPNATPAAETSSPGSAPLDGDNDAVATPVTASLSPPEEEAADASAPATASATRAAPVVASLAPEVTDIRATPPALADLGVTTEEAIAPATPVVQLPTPITTPETPELPGIATPMTPTVPGVAGLTPDRGVAAVTTPIQQTALIAPIAAQNDIARNPFYPAMAASLYLSAMTDRFQQTNGRDLDSPVGSVQPLGAVRPIAAAAFDQNSPSDDPRSGVPA